MDVGYLGKGAVIAAVSLAAYLLGTVVTFAADRGPIGTAIAKVDDRRARGQGAYAQYLERYLVEFAKSADEADAGYEEQEAALERARRTPLGELRPRLLVASAEQYGEYDRLEAEGSFRLNMVAPLAVMLAIVWTSLAWWVAMLCVVFLVGLAGRGVQRMFDSREVLRRAVIAGTVPHPMKELAASPW